MSGLYLPSTRTRQLSHIFLAICIMALGGCAGAGRSILDPVPDGGQCAKIEAFEPNRLGPGPRAPAPAVLHRDRFGTPYAIASSDAAALYAFGYAQAEDHALEILFLALQVEGRLAEAFGPDCLKSDIRTRTLGFARDGKIAAAQLPGRIRADILEPFAAGINAALAAQPRLPRWTATAGPFNAERITAIAHFYGFALALANDPHGYGGFVAEAPWRANVGRGAVPSMGSNAFALAGTRTASGAPILGAMPHLAHRHPFLLIEGGLKGDGLAVHGFTFLGLPLPIFGMNARLAWGVTIDTVDAFDRGYEVLRNTPEPAVLRHDGWRLLALRPETIKVLGKPDTVVTVREGDRGPLILDIAPGRAIALDWGGRGSAGLIEQLPAMALASDIDAFERALATLGTPNYAFTAADANGHILFAHIGHAPDRAATFAAPGGPTGCAQLSIDTITDRATPTVGCIGETLLGVPGWVEDGSRARLRPYRDLPIERDPAAGWSQAANTPPWTHTRSTRLPKCPGETVAPCRDEFSYRANDRGRRLAERLDAASTFSLEEAADVFLDAYVASADRLLPKLFEIWRRAAEGLAPGERARLEPAIRLLRDWNRLADQASRASALYHTYARVNGVEDKADDAASIAALGAAVDHLTRHFGRIDPLWSDVHRLVRAPSALRSGANVEIGIAGGIQALGTLHALDPEDAPYLGSLVGRDLRRNPVHDGRERAVFGTAATMLVELTEIGPIARTALIFGGSDDPSSPNFSDQMRELFARNRLKSVPFSRRDIEAASVRRIDLAP